MKKGLQIAILCVLSVIAILLVWIAFTKDIWIIEGLNGEAGTAGEDGQNGKNAYELACEDGFKGSLQDWLLSLAIKGEDGKNGINGQNGVSVRNVRVSENGDLFVTLTNGIVLNAGRVGQTGENPSQPDAEGFVPVYEMVKVYNCYELNLRKGPAATYESVGVVPVGTELLRVGVNENLGAVGWSKVVCEKDGVSTVCYASSYYLELKYTYDGALPSILLPDDIQLSVGVCTQFMTDRIVPDLPDNMRVRYSYTGSGNREYMGEEMFALTPGAVGNETLTLSLELWDREDWRVAAQKEVAVRVVSPSQSKTLDVMVLGDSHVSSTGFLSALQACMPSMTLMGIRQSGGVSHEGRPSWSASDYCTQSVKNGLSNPFYNSTSRTFDFSYYLSGQGIDAPDAVILMLGEHISSPVGDAEAIEKIVKSIKAASPTTQVLILTQPVFPESGYLLQSDVDLEIAKTRAYQAAYTVSLIDTLGAWEGDGYVVLPTFLCIDDRFDRSYLTQNGEALVSDLSLLSDTGYARIAEMIFSILGA